MAKLTKEIFIERSRTSHKIVYDYSLVKYEKNDIKVCIICPIHGEFWQSPDKHMVGQDCPECSKRKAIEHKNFKNKFILKAKEVHGDKYNYDKVKYVNAKTPVTIVCLIHGDFEITPDNHVSKQGSGCQKCAKNYRYNTLEWIEQASIVHKNKYDYSKVKYINAKEKVKIICRKHGEFNQQATSHMQGIGCPICNYSKGELLIYNWLKENNITFRTQFELITEEIARNSNLIRIDFFIKHNSKQYFIEYDGIQHFEYTPHFHKEGIIDFEKQERRDELLNNFCNIHKDKVTLLRIKHTLSENDIIEKLNTLILN